MRKVSIVIPYYEDPWRLEALLCNEALFEYFDDIIIVDDGSVERPAKKYVLELLEDCPQYASKISLFRIKQDLGFNAHGARNLGMSFVRNDWVFLMDVDQVPDSDWCEKMHKAIDECAEDEFIVVPLHEDEDPGNIFLCRADQFWSVGGYDEELVGWHLGDRLFRYRLDKLYKPKNMATPIKCNRYGRNVVFDPNIEKTLYPDDRTVVQRPMEEVEDKIRLVEERNLQPERWRSIQTLMFDWEKVI